MAGLFISLDGVDGGGKSTQIGLLCDWFEARGEPTLVVRDPGGTQLGEALRDILLHRQEIPLSMTAEMLLYMASRAQLVADVIQPALAANKTVISDRFLLANVVYQGAAGGLDVDAIWQVGKVATGGLTPDLTIVLDVDAQLAMSRLQGGLDRLESRGLEYMHKVRAGFQMQSRRLGAAAVVVDAAQSIDNIHQLIVAAVESRLKAAKGR